MAGLATTLGTLFAALVVAFFLMRVMQVFTGRTRKGVVMALMGGLALCWLLSLALEEVLDSRKVLPPLAGTAALFFWFFRDYRLAAESETADLVPVVVLATTDAAGKIHDVSYRERVAFHFLLFAWGLCALLLCFTAYAYVQSGQIATRMVAVARAGAACSRLEMARIPECQQSSDWSSARCEVLYRERCRLDTADNAAEHLRIARQAWQSRMEDAGYGALFLLLVTSFGFYGFRWAFVGRLRPFWLLGR